MKRQSELLKSRPHRFKKPIRISLLLKAYDHIIGIAHNDDVAGGLLPSPAFGPQV
jgi:hypothetical protein